MKSLVKSAVWTGEAQDLLVLNLQDGSRRVFPKETIETVSDACAIDAANVELLGNGYYLHWPALDFDLYVPALLQGVSGSESWMSHLGRQGGLARTEKKAAAARANGRRGGRPCRTKSGRVAIDAGFDLAQERSTTQLESTYRFTLGQFAVAFTTSQYSKPEGVPRFM
jgi:hypothetical protein